MNVELARRQMIEQQVRAWEVLDPRVLGVMAQVRRELFVPPAYRDVAFADTAIPLGHGSAMLPPKVEGRILQSLELSQDEAVLEVGTGTGFFAACLARLAGAVRTLEIRAEFCAAARENLRAAGISGVTIETADGMKLDGSTLYDAIAVTGSLPVHDPRFERALKVGGRLFIVIGSPPVMEAVLVRRVSEMEWLRDSLFETVVEQLVNAPQAPKFVF
jgi:protein-L-isoaspartate(D-aspartate) O-methyltransferase